MSVRLPRPCTSPGRTGRSLLTDDRPDLWDLFTLGLWFVFFLAGLVPELAFYAIREWAAVTPYTALVNSSAVITLAFAAYLSFFAFRRCRQAGVSLALAQGKALEVGLIALVAFIEVPAKGSAFQSRTLLGVLADIQELPDGYLQMVVFFVGATKIVAWAYLFSLVIRYHAFGNRAIFAQIPSMLPSMHAAEHNPSDAAPRAPDHRTRCDADGHQTAAASSAHDAETTQAEAGRGVAGK